MHVPFELRALQVRGLVGALQGAAAQQLLGVQALHAQAGACAAGERRAHRSGGAPFASHRHSSAPLRHTYTNATTSSTMNVTVSASA